MNISNYYWYFSGVLTPRFCDEVINYANEQKEVMAKTGGYEKEKLTKEDVKNIQKKRKSDLVWLNDTWIYKELHPYVHEDNRRKGRSWDIPLKNNMFIMFPSTSMYYLTNYQKDSLNFVQTVTYEYI